MTLADAITQYVDLKQSMGMRFQTERRLLQAFRRQVGDVPLADVSSDAVAVFLAGTGSLTATWLNKHRTLRAFYRHWIARGRITHTPVPTVVPRVVSTFVPHVYDNDELRRLLDAIDANQARPGCQISAATFRVLLLLLYGAGLRIGEALNLTRGDVELQVGLLLIRETKFYKSRALPLGPTLVHLLADHAERAPRGPARERAAPFFTTTRGAAIKKAMARAHFVHLRTRAGVHGRAGAGSPPRLHDLRHSFAVNRLVAWYREGADVQRLLPHLSIYLGHRRMVSTQRYLTMIPELLEHANRRFERYATTEASHA
jgi:integrase/recombinase XerD